MKKLLCWYYYGHYLWYKLIREPEKDIVYNIALITSGLITAICMCIRQIMSLYFGVSWPFSYVFIFSVVIIDVVSYLKLPSVIKKHDKKNTNFYDRPCIDFGDNVFWLGSRLVDFQPIWRSF